MNSNQKKKIQDALEYALTILKDQAERGLYPELALQENGGSGFQPISDALDLIKRGTFNVSPINWIEYINNHDSNPTRYGKYLVHRKDGKIHWETWNGCGWAYNDNVITHWCCIISPNIETT
jgi:hypothetical protein